MARIENIAVLDARNIQEVIANEISEIKNVAILIGNDRSQELLKHVRMVNVAENLKLPDEEKVSFMMKNGSIKMDKEYLIGLVNPIYILVNGIMELKNDIDSKLLDEKIYALLVNGEVVCPKNLSGVIESKGSINGVLTAYSSNYIFIDKDIKLNNRFLKTIKDESKISLKKLIVLEELDEYLLKEKIKNIEVLNKLIITEENEEKLGQYIDDYHSVDKRVIDGKGKDIKYIDGDVTINNLNIDQYRDSILYVDGKLEIKLNNIDSFNKYINSIIADKVICNKETYQIIKASINKDTEVEIVEGQTLENIGKMTLTGVIEHRINIKNMGKLTLDEKLDYDSFSKNVISIVNLGAIEAPEEKIELVQSKLVRNVGKIKATIRDKQEDKEEEESGDIMYANMAELRL